MVVDGKKWNTLQLWIEKVLLLFSKKWQADRSERIYTFLHYIYNTRLVESIYRENGCVCLRWNTTDAIDYDMREADTAKFFVGEWTGL